MALLEKPQSARCGIVGHGEHRDPCRRARGIPDVALCNLAVDEGCLLYVHNDRGTRDVPLVGGGGPSRRGELIELYEAVVLDKPVRHTGSWGMATLEVCLAIMQSAKERREIMLSHQVPAPQAD